MEGLLLPLGAVFVLSTILLFILHTERRDIILKRFRLRRGSESGSRTPPQSLSPEKRKMQSTSTPDYSTTFPPSRSSALAGTKLSSPVDAVTASPSDWTKRILPITASYLEASDETYTPCEFSIKEIKALGDFPDYAALSGVPLPQPYFDFNIKKALPRPYRPFRWAYHQTMSLTKMEPDWWLELENTYEDRMKQRAQLLIDYGSAVLQALPGSELACKELMEMVLQFLCVRYPHYFSLNSSKTVFHNAILQTQTDLEKTQPLHVIFQNIPEDFAIMLRDERTGLYIFRAGIICSSLGWSLASKIGLPLHEIHAPIPDYKAKMQFSMDRYFAKKPADKPIQRGSWGLEVDQPLFMPPGDSHEGYRGVQLPGLELSRCHLRVDWQTLRRLPLSGAVVFNFKALFTPVEEFRDEPYVPGLVLKVLNEGKRELMEYKNAWHTEHVVKPALEAWHREQVEMGVVKREWEPRTLDESPWFPGWEEKWRRRQGF
ncbi:hypothetical protein SLS61_007446 [Didymella pomorum]